MKTTTITVETERLVIVSRAELIVGWCSLCNRHQELVPLDNSAFIQPTLAVRIQQWIDAGKLHVCGPENGVSGICLASLLCCFETHGNSGIRIAKEAL